MTWAFAGSPMTSPSTVPRCVFRIHPPRPRVSACSDVESRKNTPAQSFSHRVWLVLETEKELEEKKTLHAAEDLKAKLDCSGHLCQVDTVLVL